MTGKTNGNVVLKIVLGAALAFIVGTLSSSWNNDSYATKAEARAIAVQEDEKMQRYFDVKFEAIHQELRIHTKTHEDR